MKCCDQKGAWESCYVLHNETKAGTNCLQKLKFPWWKSFKLAGLAPEIFWSATNSLRELQKPEGSCCQETHTLVSLIPFIYIWEQFNNSGWRSHHQTGQIINSYFMPWIASNYMWLLKHDESKYVLVLVVASEPLADQDHCLSQKTLTQHFLTYVLWQTGMPWEVQTGMPWEFGEYIY